MIGIFGGTFDPVHFGHLRPALEVMEALSLEEVRFIPAGRPNLRDAPQASAEQRLAMLERAVAGQPGFVIDEREIHRQGVSYMVDTLASVREEIGARPLCLILGYDAFLKLHRWHRWERIPELAHLVVAHRPGWDGQGPDAPLQRLLAERSCAADALADRPAGCIVRVAVTQLDISATRIRELVHGGRDIRFLLPDSVRDYIIEQRLYTGNDLGT